MSISRDMHNKLRDMAAISFETGHFPFETFEDFKDEFPHRSQEHWEHYCELINLGPAGFYEEFKDEYDFDPMFIEEYSLQ